MPGLFLWLLQAGQERSAAEAGGTRSLANAPRGGLRDERALLACVSYIPGHSTSLILHRDPPYQAQLILKCPDSVMPPHRHPNVDSIEVYVGGHMQLVLDGVFVCPGASVGLDKCHPVKVAALRGSAVRVFPNQLHGGVIGTSGGVFLSVQKWLNGLPPTFVQFDWSVPALHEEHLRRLQVTIPLLKQCLLNRTLNPKGVRRLQAKSSYSWNAMI